MFSESVCTKLKKKTGELFDVAKTEINDKALAIVDFYKP